MAPTADEVEVRTLHALARQVLLDAGQAVELVADRLPPLRAARRRAAAQPGRTAVPEASVLDGLLSAWKIEGRAPPPEAETALAAYESLLAARGLLDFHDLVVRAVRLLDEDSRPRERWQSRFSHVLVDEFQDVDSAQLRLVQLLAAPQENLSVVGDDDQTIYAWRLADVNRQVRRMQYKRAARFCRLPRISAVSRAARANIAQRRLLAGYRHLRRGRIPLSGDRRSGVPERDTFSRPPSPCARASRAEKEIARPSGGERQL
jgi:hypothetical protein